MAPRRNTEREERFVTGTLEENNKNKRNLVCNGHTYRVNLKRPRQNIINWRYVKETICNVTARTAFYDLATFEPGTTVEVKLNKEHLHASDRVKVEAQAVVAAFKRRVRSEPNELPTILVQEAINAVDSQGVLMRLPERQTLLKSVERAQNSTWPQNPKNLEDLTIRPTYNMTIGEDMFLQLDTVVNGIRVMMFCTIQGLQWLCRSDEVFCDWTFGVAPKLFFQVCTSLEQLG